MRLVSTEEGDKLPNARHLSNTYLDRKYGEIKDILAEPGLARTEAAK